MTIPNTTRKSQLRTEIRRLLRAAPPASAAICETGREWLAARPEARTVALFAALPEEVDLLPLLAWDPTRCWLFPRVAGDHLVFHQVREPVREFIAGPLGLREPAPALPVVSVPTIDVFLCPGLAFDDRGGRLGRGRGFYDRVLALARPDALKVGVCQPFQRVADTYPEPHDVPMDWIIDSGPPLRAIQQAWP